MIKNIIKFFKRVPIKTQKIKAVQESDLINLLKSLGIYQELLDGKHNCQYCGCSITLENLQALVPENGKIKFICSNIKCISKLEK